MNAGLNYVYQPVVKLDVECGLRFDDLDIGAEFPRLVNHGAGANAVCFGLIAGGDTACCLGIEWGDANGSAT